MAELKITWPVIISSALIGGFFFNPLQDLVFSLNIVISTNESTQIITGHVIYNPAYYTYKFQLKTTFISFYLTNSIAHVYICFCIYFPLYQILICTCQYDFGIFFNLLALWRWVDVDGSVIVEVECFVGFDRIGEIAKGTSKFFIIKCYEISIV